MNAEKRHHKGYGGVMGKYTEKELDEKIKAFLASRKVHEFEFQATRKEKSLGREKTSMLDWLIPVQFKTQWR